MTQAHHQVRDGATRVIEFDGELLGEAPDSDRGPRWTRLRLYKTDAGVYVLEKAGMSVVVHAPNCPDIIGSLPRFQEVHPGADPADGTWWICERCGNTAIRGHHQAAGGNEPLLGDDHPRPGAGRGRPLPPQERSPVDASHLAGSARPGWGAGPDDSRSVPV